MQLNSRDNPANLPSSSLPLNALCRLGKRQKNLSTHLTPVLETILRTQQLLPRQVASNQWLLAPKRLRKQAAAPSAGAVGSDDFSLCRINYWSLTLAPPLIRIPRALLVFIAVRSLFLFFWSVFWGLMSQQLEYVVTVASGGFGVTLVLRRPGRFAARRARGEGMLSLLLQHVTRRLFLSCQLSIFSAPMGVYLAGASDKRWKKRLRTGDLNVYCVKKNLPINAF